MLTTMMALTSKKRARRTEFRDNFVFLDTHVAYVSETKYILAPIDYTLPHLQHREFVLYNAKIQCYSKPQQSYFNLEAVVT